ncbi:cytochrome P450 monooxygenase [Metarhizium acridum CQMa 102]|uniref:Cytochrome P450 monooxygenase n=1 Tax=Metarhizium acridum (strain CQMa 102) TaxID=655827 RepID=E9E514_METAQ|nr:cytochrome P450 monooxygenase [Metarhizium acridum CQMa 102]EFY89031.1 cytochrome P450 monooxygenase [Metarhizium acridum CQMa 102]
MATQQFHLLGESPSTAIDIPVSQNLDADGLKHLIASYFAIVEPSGIGFQGQSSVLLDVADVISATGPVAISVDGRAVRDPPGPRGLPYVGNFFEVYPDHLGNHQRLFEYYGPVIKTNNMGRVTYHTNDPKIAAIAFVESDFFTKKINAAHPLYAIKAPSAGIFLGDTDTPEWRVAHKFLPPALGPKAVRHYAPTMQKTVEDAFKVFDALDEQKEAWNVYQYMLKLGSQAVVDESIQNAARGGVEDLPLQDAALKAANVVDYSIRAIDNKGEKLPKTSLVWALVVATGAGFTTTSSLLSWLIYGLVTYPNMQERLLQELVDNEFDDNTTMTAEYTERLVFLDKYIKEMQRRHNPSYQPGRTAKVDLILPGGYKLPKEAVIIPAIHHIHNNPDLWDNPYKFDPDRWDTDKVKNRHKAAYVPFATGQRMCIGFNFALQEVKVFLPKLIYRYKFSREGDGTVEYDPMFQLIRPNNLYVRAERRVKWPPKSQPASTKVAA